jgi:hypothetical protein
MTLGRGQGGVGVGKGSVVFSNLGGGVLLNYLSHPLDKEN